MKKIFLALLLAISFNSFGECPDQVLTDLDFIVSSNDFKSNSKNVVNWLSEDQGKFVDDIETRYWSSQLKDWVQFNSYDHMSTDRMEMFGDVVVLRRLSNNEIVEVRWYENSKKYISYNKNYQNCASELIPLVDNALF